MLSFTQDKIISVSDIQGNFKEIMTKVSEKDYLIAFNMNKPVAVLVDVDFFSMLFDLQEKFEQMKDYYDVMEAKMANDFIPLDLDSNFGEK